MSRRVPSAQRPDPNSSRRRVLELLRQAPEGLGVLDLAQRSGLHANTVRFHLNRLVAAGLARRHVGEPGLPGRPRLTFAAVPEHELDSGQRNYQLLADMLAGFIAEAVPDPAGQAQQVGRAWGSYLAARPAPGHRVTVDESLRELLRVLDDIGFSPLLRADDDGQHRILLRHCPFLEVATARGEVVCSLHLGLMQGVLEELRAPVEATQLQPFVQPSLCLAHLGGHSSSHHSGAC